MLRALCNAWRRQAGRLDLAKLLQRIEKMFTVLSKLCSLFMLKCTEQHCLLCPALSTLQLATLPRGAPVTKMVLPMMSSVSITVLKRALMNHLATWRAAPGAPGMLDLSNITDLDIEVRRCQAAAWDCRMDEHAS